MHRFPFRDWTLALMPLLALAAHPACSEEKATPASSSPPQESRVAPSAPKSSAAAALPIAPQGKFRICTSGNFGTPPASKFDHLRSKAVAKLGRVAHSAQDLLVRPGEAATITGKFAYGRVSKDMEHETVVVFLDTCQSYAPVGTVVTDDDGRSALAIPSASLPAPGVYTVTQVMRGDASMVSSRLTIAPQGSRFVVFDLDGTLTVGDGELADQMKSEYLEELFADKKPAEAYPDAAALTKAWAAKGYLIVYLTGRPYWLSGLTRRWLDAQGLAPGHLHTTDRTRDARPSEAGVGEYKRSYLQSLLDVGYQIDYAYGNAESDVFAYGKAGIDPQRTYIIGEHGGEGGTQALTGGYGEHLKWVSAQPEAAQPFVIAAP
jgi:hypothetical protein